jgi:hypothetical protein
MPQTDRPSRPAAGMKRLRRTCRKTLYQRQMDILEAKVPSEPKGQGEVIDAMQSSGIRLESVGQDFADPLQLMSRTNGFQAQPKAS